MPNNQMQGTRKEFVETYAFNAPFVAPRKSNHKATKTRGSQKTILLLLCVFAPSWFIPYPSRRTHTSLGLGILTNDYSYFGCNVLQGTPLGIFTENF